MSDPCTPSRVVAVHGETLDIHIPAQADRFLGFVTSYQAAERLQLEPEFLLAQRIVSAAQWDLAHPDGDDDEDPAPLGRCPCGGAWVCTGTAYGGDDESYHGEGRIYCDQCNADGDA
jgi:hypothetical protein